jgi:hypothetical protein
MQLVRLNVLLTAGASLILIAGCSSEGSISGKVTYQGRPVTGGTIVFTSDRGSGRSTIA